MRSSLLAILFCLVRITVTTATIDAVVQPHSGDDDDFHPPDSSYVTAATQQHDIRSSKTIEIKMAVICPRNRNPLFSISTVLPAIELATEHPTVRARLSSCCRVTLKSADSNNDAVAAPIQAYKFFTKDKVHILLGPTSDYSLAPVARYAPYWNLPIISPGGMAHIFGEGKRDADAEFPLLTRVGATFDGLAWLFDRLVTAYNWNDVKILYTSSGHSEVTVNFCLWCMNGIVHHFKRQGFQFHIYKFNPLEGAEEYEDMLKQEVGNDYASKNESI